MKRILLPVLLLALVAKAIGQIDYPGPAPGKAEAKVSAKSVLLQNNCLAVSWQIAGGRIHLQSIAGRNAPDRLALPESSFFEVVLRDGARISSHDFLLKATPALASFKGNAKAVRYAEREDGKKVMADLEEGRHGLRLHWEAVMRNGSNYVQQVFRFSTRQDSLAVQKIALIQLPARTDLQTAGEVDGSPLVFQNFFFALEHPMSQVERDSLTVSAFLPRQAPLKAKDSFSFTTAMGITPKGQLRRAYLYYVERERANPYHQFLHYNSWYDLSWIDRKLTEAACLDRIRTFADSLVVKRQVPVDAFLLDDGWDDNRTLWQFNAGFPNGFAALAQAANRYKAHLGVWISPWGGYLDDQKQRLAYGRKQQPAFETNANGFSLTGPVYYNRFREVAKNFISNYDVSLFKFDGVGAGNGASGAGVAYQKDIEALLRLVRELRAVNPKEYFSLTVGTWPSVFWLQYGDAIWRAGKDTDKRGVGSNRQQWITYRDAETFKNVVKRAPLYPLNSVMYHGICIAENGPPAKFERNDRDISDEIWCFFGNGTGLQEMYINPHLLSSNNWNCLADAIRWSKANERVLTDVHWVGGDPGKLEVYGFAAWSPKKAVLTLRNPSAERKSFVVHAADAFQLPEGAAQSFSYYNAKDKAGEKLARGRSVSFVLEPFEVKVLDALPD